MDCDGVDIFCPYEHWFGMPEYSNTIEDSAGSVTIYFRNDDDRKEFEAIIERDVLRLKKKHAGGGFQTQVNKVRSCWFPPRGGQSQYEYE